MWTTTPNEVSAGTTGATQWNTMGTTLTKVTGLDFTDDDIMIGLPTHRAPTHPGEMLSEEFLKPLGITQTEAARQLGISYVRLNEIINGRRGVTPDTALRLSRRFGMTPEFWLGLQTDWDLYQALQSPGAKEINKIKLHPELTPVR